MLVVNVTEDVIKDVTFYPSPIFTIIIRNTNVYLPVITVLFL